MEPREHGKGLHPWSNGWDVWNGGWKELFKDTCLQLFRQRLSHKTVKACATMPIGIMGSESLALLDWGLRWLDRIFE